MLYVPPPYSSGTNLSVCEQSKYTINTPPSPPTALVSSDLHGQHEMSDCYHLNDNKNNSRESPPLTPKQVADLQAPGSSVTIMDGSFFMKQQQMDNGDYVLYNNGYEDTTDYHDNQEYDHPQQDNYLYESFYSTTAQGIMTDDYFETANRAFHATINKFSRQNYPEHRKRNIYNFLENWHLHSMYSKSQQILLGIPHVRPMVLLSGDDFMFTPPLLQEQQPDDDDDYEEGEYTDYQQQQELGYLDQSMQMEWVDDDGQMFEENEMDDGVMIMSAPDPPRIPTSSVPPPPLSPILNENAWMKNHMNLISESCSLGDADNEHEDQKQRDVSFSSRPHFLGEITSELLHWYRTSDQGRPPSTIMEKYATNEPPNEHDKEHVASSGPLILADPFAPISYQSLADIVPPTHPGTSLDQKNSSTSLVSQLATASDLALAMASDYRSDNSRSTRSFIRCMFQIWQVFMLTAETVLIGLWGRKDTPSSSVDSILPF